MSATTDKLNAFISKLPQIAARVAQKAAARLSAFAAASFDARQSPYGYPWREGKYGPIDLVETGAMRAAAIMYVAAGTKIRSTVARVRYAKYNIRYGILPRGGQELPAKWENEIRTLAYAEIRAVLDAGSAPVKAAA